MVAGSSALETPEHVSVEMGRKGSMFSSFGRFIERTFAPHLVAFSFKDDKPQKFKDFSHRYVGSKLPKVDARHDGT